MHVKNSKPLRTTTLLDYQYDGSSLYLLGINKGVRLISLCADSLETLTNATIESPVHFVAKPTIDESHVYLPTKVGHILALDKYTGGIVRTMDLGTMMIMSDLHCDKDNIYCMGGLPISNGAVVSNNNFCLNVLDKHSGKKIAQGPCSPSIPNFMTVDEDIWCVAKHEIHRYSKEAELKEIKKVSFQPGFSPIITDSYVVVASKTGALEIFYKDTFTKHNNTIIGMNNSPPVAIGDSLYWFLRLGVVAVDLKTSKVSILADIRNDIISSTILHEGAIYGCNTKGEIVRVDVASGEVQRLKLSDTPLWKPVATDEGIFVASKEKLYQVV